MGQAWNSTRRKVELNFYSLSHEDLSIGVLGMIWGTSVSGATCDIEPNRTPPRLSSSRRESGRSGCFCPGMARMSPPLRASNEGLLTLQLPQGGVGRLFFTARIERAHSYRARSASKKNGLPAPSHSSEAAGCASTGDSPGHPSPAGGLSQQPAVRLARRP